MSARACGSPRPSSASPERTRRCWCRWSTAARRSACWPRSIAAPEQRAVHRGGRAAAADVRRQRRERGRDGAERARPTGCGARSRPPTPSGGAGRASSTTRRCRGSGAAGAALLRAAARGPRTSTSGDARGDRGDRERDREPARDHHRPASRRARRPRAARGDRGADRAPPRATEPRSRASSTSPDPRPARRLDAELETTVYRLMQEAFTNVVKHAQAEQRAGGSAKPTASSGSRCDDDGVGFAADAQTGIRSRRDARARLSGGGTLEISSDERGTIVKARLPARVRAAASDAGTLARRAGRVLATAHSPTRITAPASIRRAAARPRPPARVTRPAERRHAG